MSYMSAGALPAGLKQPMMRPQKALSPGSFRDGPQIAIKGSPFIFPDDGKEHTRTYSQQWFGSADGMATQKWIGIKLGQIEKKYKTACQAADSGVGVGGGMLGGVQMDPWRTFLGGRCTNKFKTWSISKRIPPKVWRGQIPMARTKHPTTGREWGIYIHFDDNTLRVRWKPIPRNIFARIWDAIIAVVSFIIKTVKELFGFLMSLGCILANSRLQTVTNIAEGKEKLTPAHKAALTAAGAPPGAVEALAKDPTVKVATEIGNAIVSTVCKVDPPLAQDTGPNWLLWGAVGVVGVIGVLVLVRR